MAYDAVYDYADEDSSTYHEYQLTYEPVRDGDDEIETEDGTRYKKKSQKNGIKLVLKMVMDVQSI
jgi:hypothetical protein